MYKQGLFFKKRLNWSDMTDREITCSQAVPELPDNSISTSKYTVLSFVPKNLFLQFSKMANLYFLVSNPPPLFFFSIDVSYPPFF